MITVLFRQVTFKMLNLRSRHLLEHNVGKIELANGVDKRAFSGKTTVCINLYFILQVRNSTYQNICNIADIYKT